MRERGKCYNKVRPQISAVVHKDKPSSERKVGSAVFGLVFELLRFITPGKIRHGICATNLLLINFSSEILLNLVSAGESAELQVRAASE